MIILLFVAAFCFINARILKSKGRTPGGMIAATIGLTYGLEVVVVTIYMISKFPLMEMAENAGVDSEALGTLYSTVITELLDDQFFIWLPYITIIVGGIISLLIARAYKPADSTRFEQQNGGNAYRTWNQNQDRDQELNRRNTWQTTSGSNGWQNGPDIPAGKPYNGNDFAQPDSTFDEGVESLSVPCTICVIREASTVGADDIYTVSVNGHPACTLANNTYASFETGSKQNTVTARDGSGMSLKKPVTFMAVDGGRVEMYIKGDSFIPEKTVGRRPTE